MLTPEKIKKWFDTFTEGHPDQSPQRRMETEICKGYILGKIKNDLDLRAMEEQKRQERMLDIAGKS